jgi:hypothetical protein
MSIASKRPRLSDPAPSNSPAAKRRRTWITIGEGVGILAVIIAALSFWDSHQQRVREDRAASAAAHQAPADPVFALRGEADADGGRIHLRTVNDSEIIQEQTFVFPLEVLGQPVHTTGGADIEAVWFAGGLKKAGPKAAKGSDDDQRLPVVITTTFTVDGRTGHASGLYTIGYRLKPHFPFGATVMLRGLALRSGGLGDAQALVERAWASDNPPKKP